MHVESATESMARVIALVFLSLRAASSGGQPEPLALVNGGELLSGFQSFLDCSTAANFLSPLCTGELDAPTFRSVKHRTLLRVTSADDGSWLGCIATEMRDQLVRKGSAPRSLVAEVLATLTTVDAERAGKLLTQRAFLQAFFAVGSTQP